MNLADYLSELLGQQDEVSVPGLGYFMRTRVNAFYNEAESRFYPPYHQVTFSSMAKADDTFAQYVADKKNISLASSKYFVEKFIAKLKEDAATGKYLFADLGSFQGAGEHLIFKPSERIAIDPAFYGYTPIEISKVGSPTSELFGAAFTGTAPAATTDPGAAQVQQPAYFNEDAEPRKKLSLWVIIVIAVVAIVGGMFALNQFYPSLFEGLAGKFHKLTHKSSPDSPVIRHETKKDTVKKPVSVKDTISKMAAIAPKRDTVPNPALPHYEAIVYKTPYQADAERSVRRLKNMGFDAYIVANLPGTGTLKKISVGSYPTYAAADSVCRGLLKSRIITRHYSPVEIKPN
jgi:hypothetical protein